MYTKDRRERKIVPKNYDEEEVVEVFSSGNHADHMGYALLRLVANTVGYEAEYKGDVLENARNAKIAIQDESELTIADVVMELSKDDDWQLRYKIPGESKDIAETLMHYLPPAT